MAFHVILVEDDRWLCYAYGEILETAGYVVHPFHDYQGVMEMVDGPRQADLLVVDIALTEGTAPGRAIAAMARMHRPNLPV